MNKMDQRMARLEEEGALMVELDRMSTSQLRAKITIMLDKAISLRENIDHLSLAELAEQLGECRGELGLVMRECELRAMR